MIGAVCYKLNDDECAKIYQVGTFNSIDWSAEIPTALGNQCVCFDLKNSARKTPSIFIELGVDNEPVLRFVETKRYILKIESDNIEEQALPRLQNEEGNKFLKCDRDENSLTFQFINYLGRSKIYFDEQPNERVLSFEVVPDKMDYEDDYIRLTQALAEECASLLLEYSGATSNIFSQSRDSYRTPLEQFIFLRQFCYAQNIRSLFESIKRNPDRTLVQEESLKPAGTGKPSKRFFTNPFAYSRGWEKIGAAGHASYMPREVAITHKYDSLDTLANRFIKFALHSFYNVCETLIKALEPPNGGQAKQVECYSEAKALCIAIDDIFRDPFFDNVRDLDIMPQNNQVLQKREGYSQIFSAYSMLDLALRLDWEGKEDIYEGESKNVALLYEYWLFFELYKVIKSIEGCEIKTADDKPFIDNKDVLTVSLKEGNQSCQCFELPAHGLKLNLYYNRTFSYEEFKSTIYEGSYSRPFRPDYTLALFPNTYTKGILNGEKEALRNGAVNYIHFDAKYRITDLTSLIGKEISKDEEKEELEIDKIDSITNTYRRGDLLKMHTYNDAIRRTVGSYVLYPGSENTSGKPRFELYDEVLPGVGAFSIKPSTEEAGEKRLRDFIISLIGLNEISNSRLHRMNYFSEMVLGEPSVSGAAKTNVIESKCVIGYIRADGKKDYYYHLKSKELLGVGSEFPFYFYAIKDGNVYSHHKDIFKAEYFRFYRNQIKKDDTYDLEPILCKIVSNELVTRDELVTRLGEIGYVTSTEEHQADFYYVLNLRVEKVLDGIRKIEVEKVNAQNGNDTFSPHSPKVIGL